ncbi:hypothetical protein QJS10_CPB21g00348 [Acorus calamus]|uniref:Leucine-rich repeat-containing N-terminal plant-type domain-containing protein n=1 Tax=Acorus calamus TaxID=4465 RepID=A0AAV9C5Z0_ACOCL|nr:hypothetical protein QJS10_CPB21g00348 [Acorus calamus]
MNDILKVLFVVGFSWSCFLHGCQGCFHQERLALLEIKRSINHPNGSALSNWVGEDCCGWDGIVCDDLSSRVVSIVLDQKRESGDWYPNVTMFAQFELIELSLNGNQIKGWVMPEGLRNVKSLSLSDNRLNDAAIAPWINNLTSLLFLYLSENELRDLSYLEGFHGIQNLQVLNLSSNGLTDDSLTPWIFNLTSVTELGLSQNQLRTVPWVYNLTLLASVHLSNNQLAGPSILEGFCELKWLHNLDLQGNLLNGAIHPCLGKLQSLKYLNLSSNYLEGNIPPLVFMNLTSIEILNLSINQFVGVISFSIFANLSKLTTLGLSRNYQLEVETESPSWVPNFQLSYLYLGSCMLNKHSGQNIPSFISTQNTLQHVDLSNSSLVGSVPSWLIYNTSLNALRLHRNNLSGLFPQPHLNEISNLRFLHVGNNQINGSLPVRFGTLSPYLGYLNISGNALQGCIPSSFGEIITLGVLDLSYNKLSGEIPPALTSNTSLVILILADNLLKGNMLPKFSNMPRLIALDLHDNSFTGEITRSLLNSPSLQFFNVRKNLMEGEIPSWLGDLSKLASLLLSGNFFKGSLPSQLCQLQTLHTLDLSNNSLSGSIPPCFNNITSWRERSPVTFVMPKEGNSTFYRATISFPFTTKGVEYYYVGIPFYLMTGVDLSMNQISGTIPYEMGDLMELVSLNLSNNLLTGPFPDSFQNLENLESLDLSHNKLDGNIPLRLSQLPNLASFSVAYNNLSGCIPWERQFTTFEVGSFTGNPYLRGQLLGRNCSDGALSDANDEQGDGELRIIECELAYYIFVAVSFLVGFMGVIASLVFVENWRTKCFHFVDKWMLKSRTP